MKGEYLVLYVGKVPRLSFQSSLRTLVVEEGKLGSEGRKTRNKCPGGFFLSDSREGGSAVPPRTRHQGLMTMGRSYGCDRVTTWVSE